MGDYTEVYSEVRQTTKMERLAKLVAAFSKTH